MKLKRLWYSIAHPRIMRRAKRIDEARKVRMAIEAFQLFFANMGKMIRAAGTVFSCVEMALNNDNGMEETLDAAKHIIEST